MAEKQMQIPIRAFFNPKYLKGKNAAGEDVLKITAEAIRPSEGGGIEAHFTKENIEASKQKLAENKKTIVEMQTELDKKIKADPDNPDLSNEKTKLLMTKRNLALDEKEIKDIEKKFAEVVGGKPKAKAQSPGKPHNKNLKRVK